MLGEDNLCAQNERYQLGWAGKSDAYRTLQSPTFNTLAPCIAESVDFHDTQNVFIEAENLEALKILQKSYAGKVKMIYIDPPYNTGSDSFVYPDKFAETREEYARRVGDKDQEGYLLRDGAFAGAWRKNSKDNGHYHSNWLSMMLPRLHLAKTLLREDGVIFISIDNHEQAQLKLLCDEVFGAENFVETFSWVKTSTPPSLSAKSRKTNEYILCYEKNKDGQRYDGEQQDEGDEPLLNTGNTNAVLTFSPECFYFKFMQQGTLKAGIYEKVELLDDVEIVHYKPTKKIRIRGEFKWTQENLEKEIKKGTIFIAKTEKLSIRFLRQEKGTKCPTNFIRDEIITPLVNKKESGVDTNETASKLLEKLLGTKIFSYPKPTTLLQYLIKFKTSDDDVIMDFFAGSGSLAHAVMELNQQDSSVKRKFICIQIPEELDLTRADSKEEKEIIANAIKFCQSLGLPKNIAEIAKERIRRAGTQLQGSLKDGQSVDTGFKVFKLTESHFKQWRRPLSGSLNEQQQLALLEEFQNIVHENAGVENMAYELMLRLGFELTDSIEFVDHVVWLNNAAQTRKTALLLDTVNQAVLDEVRAQSPKKVFVLDKAFAGHDALKTNAALQFKDANIDFETL